MFLQFAYNGRLRTVACPVEVSPWTPQGYEDRGQQPRPPFAGELSTSRSGNPIGTKVQTNPSCTSAPYWLSEPPR